jgi:peptidoglycan/xylan/chitin deacetylase (PgdA/CDA1 family)
MGILVYHMVDSRFSLGVTRITPRRFIKHVHSLLNAGFQFITISDYLSTSASEKNVALTFDDGYESVFQHAFSVMQSLNLPASVFINPAYVGQWNTWDINLAWRRFRLMDWRQLEILRQQGWEVGIHGLSHKDLSRLSKSQLETEIGLALQIMRRRLGDAGKVISYPFGNADKNVWQMCSNHGLTAGLTMSRKPRSIPDEFSIQRYGVYPFDSLKTLRDKASAQQKRQYRVVQRIMDFCSDATVLVKRASWDLD